MSLTTADQTWAVEAACSSSDPDALFVRGAAQRQVRQVCFSCPVRLNCLADALDSETTFGVWGGLTERERRALLRRYPKVTDWYERLTKGEDQIAVDLRNGRVPRLGDR
ncbi:WhiB family transcriptional regulator [Changpingibacter yushuensis]|uniref:WhiB family transcriptional regulator n=1 Tax=Changpingibacter yushuensis TaxID=2758440 RepID=UPI0015F3957C|nr:WhiB family transcriptional regulator [Changpingibacter yushuensis]